MAELSLTHPVTTSSSGSSGGGISLSKRVLIRTGGRFDANTVLDLNTPGTGWVATGSTVTFSGSGDFVDNTQVYRNGQLLLPGESSAADNDTYFVNSTGSIAFEFPLITNDVVQVWKFGTGSTGSSGGGLTEAEHEILDTLVHNISENAHVEIIRNANSQVTNVIFRTSPGGTLIRSTAIVRNGAGQAIQTIETQYNGSGVAVQTLTTDINRTGNQVSSLDLTET